jgi:phosphoglycerate dehydrogenase-like enzyme
MRPKALFVLSASSYDLIYGAEERAAIAELCELPWRPQTKESLAADPSPLREAEFIFSGWGAPRMDADFLALAPALRAVFYGAGSVKSLVSEAFWRRGIVLTSSWAANGIPVAEFTVAEIVLSLKHVWYYMLAGKREGRLPAKRAVPGLYGSCVGLISLGMIGLMVAERLRGYELKVIAYDPFVSAAEASALGVELVGLDELFSQADVVSLHTPWLKETEKMIEARHFALMKQQATFLNTARGAVVDEAGMIGVLQERPDLMAILDVTYPEPPEPDSPLYSLPNVLLTPHIAGSLNQECRRMGRYAVEECRRYMKGEALQWQLSEAMAATLA